MSEASAKKRRKSEDPSAKSSKRQKTLDTNAPPPARNLTKVSPIPLPIASHDAGLGAVPAARAKASPAPSSTKKTKAAPPLPATSVTSTAATGSSGMKKTPILPPALSSPLKKSTPAVTKKSTSLPKRTKIEPPTTNGTKGSKNDTTSKPLKRTPIKPPEIDDSSTSNSSKHLRESAEESAVTTKADKNTKAKKASKDRTDAESHPEGNLDATNEITGRELPETGDATVVIEGDESTHMEMEQPRKKQAAMQRTPPKELPGSTEPDSDEDEDEEESESESSEEEQTDEIEPPSQKQKQISEEPAYVTEARSNRDKIRKNINVSIDFGLEGVLRIPKDGLYNTGYHFFETYMYLDVPPIGVGYPLEAAVNIGISQYLFDYYPPANGILLCHTNHRICPPPKEAEESLTKISAGYADNNLWVAADLYIFRPTKGAWLRGTIGLQTETHIAIMILGHWPASVERKRLPKSWRWVPDDDDDSSLAEDDFTDPAEMHLGGAGYWSDGNGKPVMGEVIIRALDFDMVNDNKRGGTVISIEASMLDEEDDKAADEIDELNQPRLLTRSPMYARAHAPAKATSSRVADADAMDIDRPAADPSTQKMSKKKKGKQVAT